MKTYIAGSPQHCDIIVQAHNSREAKDKYAQILGYENYDELKKDVGIEIGYIDLECLYDNEPDVRRG